MTRRVLPYKLLLLLGQKASQGALLSWQENYILSPNIFEVAKSKGWPSSQLCFTSPGEVWRTMMHDDAR